MSCDADYTSWQRKMRQPVLSHLSALTYLSCTGEGLFAVQADEVRVTGSNGRDAGLQTRIPTANMCACSFAHSAAPSGLQGRRQTHAVGDCAPLTAAVCLCVLSFSAAQCNLFHPSLLGFAVWTQQHVSSTRSLGYPLIQLLCSGAAPQPGAAGGCRLPQGCSPAVPDTAAGAGHAGKHHGRTQPTTGEPLTCCGSREQELDPLPKPRLGCQGWSGG